MNFTAVRGMPDILPDRINQWHYLEQQLHSLTRCYGFEEIRLPILEQTQLFKRSIGEVTDIVEKEMFTFDDHNGVSLSLRPEGTASCIRACLEHTLLRQKQLRLWYLGPMFRYERPQKGRYRQFYQFGVESFGIDSPEGELEQILLAAHLWQALGIGKKIKLEINNLGNAESRSQYRQNLTSYFNQHKDALDDDSKRRLTTNPLRILDSKNPQLQQIIAQAPKIVENLDDQSQVDFEQLQKNLTTMQIPFTVNHKLVRGLDYYNSTVYEWLSEDLGAQSAVCAGGRYDQLVAQLGGEPISGVGFAMGLERILMLLDNHDIDKSLMLDGYLIYDQRAVSKSQVLQVGEKIRQACPDFSLRVHLSGGSFKNQFKKADKSNARLALIVGEEEIAQNMISVKFLRQSREQLSIHDNQLATLKEISCGHL